MFLACRSDVRGSRTCNQRRQSLLSTGSFAGEPDERRIIHSSRHREDAESAWLVTRSMRTAATNMRKIKTGCTPSTKSVDTHEITRHIRRERERVLVPLLPFIEPNHAIFPRAEQVGSQTNCKLTWASRLSPILPLPRPELQKPFSGC